MSSNPVTDPTGLAERRLDQKSPRAVLGRLLGWSFVLLALISTVVVTLFELRHPRCDDGVLAADMIGIVPRVAGPIKELPIVDNQFVHKGDLLFEIDTAPYKLSVDAAAANLAMAEGEVKNTQDHIASQQEQAKAAAATMQQAKDTLAEAKDNYDRLAPLLAKHYATALDVDHARQVMESATTGVAAAQAQMFASRSAVLNIAPIQAKRDAAAVALAQAELALSYCTVKAPFDGLVLGMNIATGAYALVGTEVFKLIDTHSWWVSEPYLEGQLHRFKVGLLAAWGQSPGGFSEVHFDGTFVILGQHILDTSDIGVLLQETNPDFQNLSKSNGNDLSWNSDGVRYTSDSKDLKITWVLDPDFLHYMDGHPTHVFKGKFSIFEIEIVRNKPVPTDLLSKYGFEAAGDDAPRYYQLEKNEWKINIITDRDRNPEAVTLEHSLSPD